MADYEALMKMRPEVRQFVRNRRWVHRGEAIAYGPNIRCDAFSTDPAGFRHSVFKGETFSMKDCLESERYGLVLGPSSVYGFGLAGNENTMPSVLADKFGFPFGNVGLPEGNSRNLFSLLVAFIVRAKKKPSIVVHISGGDFTSFCYTSIADPVFGSPNLKQIPLVLKERDGKLPPPDRQIKQLLGFSSMWIRAIVELCRSANVPLILANDTTFFEKEKPTQAELDAKLGIPFNNAQKRQFEIHRKFVRDYHSQRKLLASKLEVPLAGPGIKNDIGFIDEFHYDRDGTASLCNDFAKEIQFIL